MSTEEIKGALEEKMTSARTADFIWLKEALPLIENVTTLITGVIAWLLVMMLGLIMCFEVLYIAVPIVRCGCDDYLDKKTKTSNKIGLLLKDSVRACKIAALSSGGKSAMIEYIKIKIVTLVWIGVIIALLLNVGRILVAVVELAILPMLGLAG